MIQHTPYFLDLQDAYYNEKKTLDLWHEKNSYSDLKNETPYPKECLFRMMDLLDIMDNMYKYAPHNDEFNKLEKHFQSLQCHCNSLAIFSP